MSFGDPSELLDRAMAGSYSTIDSSRPLALSPSPMPKRRQKIRNSEITPAVPGPDRRGAPPGSETP